MFTLWHHFSETVIFSGNRYSNHPDLDFSFPSPTYLEIRAACPRIAHLSGVAQQNDKILREIEVIMALSEDASSAEVLKHAILTLDP